MKITEENKVKPELVHGEINLPNKIKVSINAVENTGLHASPEDILSKLKKAAKEELFPPIALSNG